METCVSALSAELERAAEVAQPRAFDYFQRRGSSFGRDLDDWLRAERELIWYPDAEMTENIEK